MDGADLLRQNQRRRADLQTEYDPIRGIGSPLDRAPVRLSEELGTVYVPTRMTEHSGVQSLREAGSVPDLAQDTRTDPQRLLRQFRRLRCQHDFEYWLAYAAKVETKTGSVVPFIPNRPQRKYIRHLEKQRLEGRPVRAIVLKHRQWGATTLSYSYIAWHQLERHRRRDAWFVGLDADGARDVRERYDLIRKHYPFRDLTIRPYGGSRNTRVIEERGAKLSIGTVQRPNAPSGRPAQFNHLFEIGKWPSNPRVDASKVVVNMESMLVDEPGTVGIMESTMQGESGPYFKELCDRARRGDSAYDFLFVSVFDDPQYTLAPGDGRPLESYDPADVEAFAERWDEDMRQYWAIGATLEQLNWWARQKTKPAYVMEPWRQKEEYPVVVEDAFQSGEKPVFPRVYVQAARRQCRPPAERGELYGDAQSGEEALEGITFETHSQGRLKVWRRPGDDYGGLLEEELRHGPIQRRYCAFSDVGPGQSADADYSWTRVVDRAPVLFGGWPEVVADWRGHDDPDRYAWIAARLCRWYETAFWAIEVNTYQADKPTDERAPDYGQTVMNEVKGTYPAGQMYHRKVWDKETQEHTRKVGWHTTKKNRQVLLSAAQKRLRGIYQEQTESEPAPDAAYVERNDRACQELSVFQYIDGKARAPDGKKDDGVIATGGALHLHDELPPPEPAEPERAEAEPTATPAVSI